MQANLMPKIPKSKQSVSGFQSSLITDYINSARDFLSFTCSSSLLSHPLSPSSSPCYDCPGRENHRITSPSLLRHPKEQGLAAVDSTGRKGRSTKQKRRSRSLDGHVRERSTARRRRRGSDEGGGGGRSDLRSPTSELEEGSPDARARRRRRRKGVSESLQRDVLRRDDDSETNSGTERGRKRERERRRSKGKKRRSRSEAEVEKLKQEEKEEKEEEEREEVSAGEEKEEEKEEDKSEEEEQKEESVSLEKESEDDVFLPIPSPNLKLPRPKLEMEVEEEEEEEEKKNRTMAAEYRELKDEREVNEEQVEYWNENIDTEQNQGQRDSDETQSNQVKQPLPGIDVIDPVSQRKPFSFLTSTLSLEQLGVDESESEGSQSDGSVSAASISGLSLAATAAGGHRATLLPGPWLPPSEQRVAQIEDGETSPAGPTEQGGGRRRRNPFSLLFKRK